MSKSANYVLESLQKILDWLAAHKYWLTAVILAAAARIFAPTVFWISVIAFFLYVLVRPAVDCLHGLVKSRRLAALITIILLTGFLVFALSVIIPDLVSQTLEFIKNSQNIDAQIQSLSGALQQKLQEFQELFPAAAQISIKESISQYLLIWSNSLLNFFRDIVSSLTRVVTSILQFLVAYVLLIYMLFDTQPVEKIKAFLLRETTAKEKKMLSITYEQLTAYFGGQILMSVLSFIATWIFYAVIGLRFSLLLALWDGFMQFIPFFGPALAMAPALLVTLPDKISLIIPILIFFGIQQALLANVLAPQILSKSTRLSPLVVFLVMMIGAEVWGIWGMIISLPLTSLIILYFQTRKN
ncbi:MAG: AI-2E family transporter [Candidatus Margulisbacteria bacterium]|jgi:predicted PurR-regulated permease PerM|nr:AI-2E family transporter [Candidatus Margulisiibacteriota bacterium]